jgi:hypothetical protein
MNDLDEEARRHRRSSHDDYSVIYGTSNATFIYFRLVPQPSSIHSNASLHDIGEVYQSFQLARITM